MAFPAGSLIMVDYSAKVKGSDDMVVGAGPDDPAGAEFSSGPKLVSIGDPSHPVSRGFDEALAGSEAGQSGTVEVPPDRAYGNRDRRQVKMLNYRKLGDDADKVAVGDTVTVDGRTGVVRFMGSGRVQVDFNHRYAGKTLVYDYTVVSHLVSDDEKISAILSDADIHGDVYTLKDDVLVIRIPPSLFREKTLQDKKHILQMELLQFVPTLYEVQFVEVHKNSLRPRPEPPLDDLDSDLDDDLDDDLDLDDDDDDDDLDLDEDDDDLDSDLDDDSDLDLDSDLGEDDGGKPKPAPYGGGSADDSVFRPATEPPFLRPDS